MLFDLINKESHGLSILVLSLVIMTAVGLEHVALFGSPPIQSGVSPSLKAAILDELSVDYSSQSFVSEATSLIASAGYAVDYYTPSQVTVGLFQNLPSLGYGLIIIRAHTVPSWFANEGMVGIITGEPYSESSHVSEQLDDHLVASRSTGPTYFAITARFVVSNMLGSFRGSTIFMDGCQSYGLAGAFAAREVSSYIGWNGAVTEPFMDEATLAWLGSLASGDTPAKAVDAANNQTGRDPIYQSALELYVPGITAGAPPPSQSKPFWYIDPAQLPRIIILVGFMSSIAVIGLVCLTSLFDIRLTKSKGHRTQSKNSTG